MRIPTLALLALLPLFTLGSCKSAYYGTWERFGVHKRDILVDRVEEAREGQAQAKEQIQTTFEAFQSLTGFEGGELEQAYKNLNKEYERSADRAAEVKERIEAIESVASDLFKEWGSEIGEISDSGLRRDSEQLMRETERRYDQLVTAMWSAEGKMQPVLTAFRDRVLSLKHSLNAKAIASLNENLGEIQGDVAALIEDMQASIDEADAFLESMDEGAE